MEIKKNRETVKKRASAFLETVRKGGVFLMGTNMYSGSAIEFMRKNEFLVKGVIDDYSEELKFEGVKIFKASEIEPGANVINCVVEGRPIDAENQLLRNGISSSLDYYALNFLYPEEVIPVWFMPNENENFEEQEYQNLYEILEDNVSKTTLQTLINFRYNHDVKEMKDFTLRLKEQYFENFIPSLESPSFIDGGGFDGETTQLFFQHYPSGKKVYYFEPNTKSLQKSKDRLKERNNIDFFAKGLWNKSEILYFDNGKGSASKLSNEGTETIETTSIDEVLQGQRVDFIKLDVEGAEYNALKGAEKTIKNFKPVIAVCVYHNQIDFIRIPELLLGYRPEYKIYLRHYTQGVFETVMYFI